MEGVYSSVKDQLQIANIYLSQESSKFINENDGIEMEDIPKTQDTIKIFRLIIFTCNLTR